MKSATPTITLIPNSLSFEKRLNELLGRLSEEIQNLVPTSSRGKIHDLRVLSRRTWAGLDLLSRWRPSKGGEDLKETVRGLTQSLGPVRSLDVSHLDLKKHLDPLKKLSPSSVGFLLKWFRKNRAKSRKSLFKALEKSRIVSRIKKRLPLTLPEEGSHVSFVEVLLDESQRAGQKVFKRWQLFEKKIRIRDLHEVRIELKKWRYLLEIQAEFTGSPSASHLREMKQVQDRLGLIHDAEVLRDLLKDRTIRKEARKSRADKIVRALRKDLKSEIQSGVASFHREGEKILLQLYTERKDA